MESFIKVIILAIIQGIAEFLPISSSGHLVIAKNLMKLDSPGVLLEIILHSGTLLAIFIFYHKKILSLIEEVFSGKGEGRKYLLWIIVSMIPAILVFLSLQDKIETSFNNPLLVGIMLLLTGIILISIKFVSSGKSDLTVSKSIIIGTAQAFAMLPGVSRSGSTIAMARHLKIQPEKAAEFSFLMTIPILMGATLIGAIDVISGKPTGDVNFISMAVGFLVAAIVGLISMKILLKLLSTNKFWYFGIYCLIAGTFVIIFVN